MTVGVASTLRFISAVFYFLYEFITWFAEVAEALGNPEVSTYTAVIVVYCLARGRYKSALVSFLVCSVFDLYFSVDPRIAGPA